MTAKPSLAPIRSHQDVGGPPISWGHNARIPRGCAAVLDALKFTSVARGSRRDLGETEWRQTLRFCDESRLTLLLGHCCADELPAWVAERIRRNLQGNVTRLDCLKREYSLIAESLAAASVEHVVLKGLSHGTAFGADWRLRPQYDLDLWCREDQLTAAQDAVARLGFESVAAQARFPTDHLPPMVRKTGWEWTGDYFDPQMPLVVEIHFGLWDERVERLAASGLDQFWGRARSEQRAGMTMPVMREADQFAYAALHVLRHLLRGDLRALHVHEIGYFLNARHDDVDFWREWRDLHPPDLRRLQALACALARKWFACELPPVVAGEISVLPGEVHAWFDNYAACAVESKFAVSKDELWLHLALLSLFRDKAAVIRRRLLPLTLPGRVESEFVPEEQRTIGKRLWGMVQYAGFFVSRAWHHLRSWRSLLSSGIRWRRTCRDVCGFGATRGSSKPGIG